MHLGKTVSSCHPPALTPPTVSTESIPIAGGSRLPLAYWLSNMHSRYHQQQPCQGLPHPLESIQRFAGRRLMALYPAGMQILRGGVDTVMAGIRLNMG